MSSMTQNGPKVKPPRRQTRTHSAPLSQTPNAVKLRKRRERRGRQYALKEASARAARRPTDSAFRDAEQRRNQVRHHREWQLHPDVCEQVACDGEASDKGVYNEFGCYSRAGGHQTVENDDGVSLIDTLSLLRAHSRRVRKLTKKRSYISYFSGGYDLDQQIAQLPYTSHETKMAVARQKSRAYAARRGPGFQREVTLEPWGWKVYIGKKEHEVYEPMPGLTKDGRPKRRWTLKTHDLYSLFNRSFERTLEMFPNKPERIARLLPIIHAGKAVRGKFTGAGWTKALVKEYNRAELEAQQWVQEQVIQMCLSLGLTPRTISSPAALSRALITKYGCGSHIKPADYDTVEFQRSPWMRTIRAAFFGGRVELDQIRVLNNGYWLYDLTSAYPDADRRLPCCAHGHFRHLTRAEVADANAGKLLDWAIYRIQWLLPDDAWWGPFPVRDPQDGISLPLRGMGWYHTPEVQAAIDCAPDGSRFRIYEGIRWESTCSETHPFKEMVETTFGQRQEMLKSDDPREYILKLALNSLYGVKAQIAGSYVETDEAGNVTKYHHPKYSNLFAAGYITSFTRARMYRTLMESPDTFMAATDAVASLTPLPGYPQDKSVKELGTFTGTHVETPTVYLQPGVCARKDGEHKSRGFPPPADFYERVTEAMARGDATLIVKRNEYQDMHACDLGDRFSPERGSFKEKDHVLNLTATVLASKRMPDGSPQRGNVRVSVPYSRPFERASDRKWDNEPDGDEIRPDDA